MNGLRCEQRRPVDPPGFYDSTYVLHGGWWRDTQRKMA